MIPREIAGVIPTGEQLRVVVMWQSPDADLAWRSVGRERFESAYCPEDAIYERLVDTALPESAFRSVTTPQDAILKHGDTAVEAAQFTEN